MKAIVVDDEILARKRIVDLLKDHNEIEVIKECSNGTSAVLEINRLAPDLVFLDINMKDQTGFEVLEKIEISPKPIVIFVTAYDYALKAFDYEAFDFLLKPFKEERFFKTIKNVLNMTRKEAENHSEKMMQEIFRKKLDYIDTKSLPQQLPIRQGNTTLLLKTSKIKYIIASGYYAEIYTKEKKYVIRESLSNLIETLSLDSFFRVHRSTIINLRYIQEIVHSNYSEIDVRMKDNTLIRISKTQKKEFLAKLGF